jgi:Mn-dependent DtxR family transcriptional regulator
MMKIHESAEDYLEAMLMLQEEYGYIRSIDIAQKLNVTKPSVSFAVKQLKENGYISMAKDGSIKLLKPGMKIASKIYERHRLLTAFLEKIGVDPLTAEKDACKMEHDISEETFNAMCRHAEKGAAEAK